MGLISAEQKGWITHLLATVLMQLKMLLAFFATKVYSRLMTISLTTSASRFFFAKLLCIQLVASIYWCQGLSLPVCRILHFLLLNSMSFLLTHISSLLRALWIVVQPTGVSGQSFVSSANLMRVHSTSSSGSLIKMLNRIGPSIGGRLYLTFKEGQSSKWIKQSSKI